MNKEASTLRLTTWKPRAFVSGQRNCRCSDLIVIIQSIYRNFSIINYLNIQSRGGQTSPTLNLLITHLRPEMLHRITIACLVSTAKLLLLCNTAEAAGRRWCRRRATQAMRAANALRAGVVSLVAVGTRVGGAKVVGAGVIIGAVVAISLVACSACAAG